MMKHFSFQGLHTRKPFWLTQLSTFTAAVVSAVVMIGAAEAAPLIALLALVPLVAAVVVSYASLAKRVRDTGNNPWFALLVAIPYIGIVPYLYFGLTSRSITHGTIEEGTN